MCSHEPQQVPRWLLGPRDTAFAQASSEVGLSSRCSPLQTADLHEDHSCNPLPINCSDTSWIRAVRLLNRQGFWVPARFQPETLANSFQHGGKGGLERSSLLQQLLASVNLKLERLKSQDNLSHVVEGQGQPEHISTISTPFARHSHYDSSAPAQRVSCPISPCMTQPNTDHYSEIHAAMAQELVPISCWTDKDLAVLLHAQAELQHHTNEKLVCCCKHTAGGCSPLDLSGHQNRPTGEGPLGGTGRKMSLIA